MEPLWFPFPVAVTKMISRKEAKQIPEAMEAMRKEFARLSGRCWIESDRRGKQEVINEAKLKEGSPLLHGPWHHRRKRL